MTLSKNFFINIIMYNICNMVISPDCKKFAVNTAPLSLEITGMQMGLPCVKDYP
jgi:hypothetical protein